MSDITMKEDGSGLLITNGDLVLTQGADAVKQHITQRLKMFTGEWFLNLSEGVPYFQNILIKNPNPDVVDGLLKSTILATPGVDELLSFDLDYDAALRKLTVDFSVRVLDTVIDFENLTLGT